MRGEHYAEVLDLIDLGGSSPHARGALLHGSTAPPCAGIIPACAGSTIEKHGVSPPSGDHPRMRGEHGGASVLVALNSGSSPHARGAHPRYFGLLRWHGIIPACAGSTPTCWRRPRRARDHPRMRGEHHASLDRPLTIAGSSPHARGAQVLARVHQLNSGIIPACAGSTAYLRHASSSARDHPRMRGEHSPTPKPIWILKGSSPHARGAQ